MKPKIFLVHLFIFQILLPMPLATHIKLSNSQTVLF